MAARQRLYIGDSVRIPGPMGWIQVIVTAVDYPRGVFTDDLGRERKISSILR